jgi:hypothetical protein
MTTPDRHIRRALRDGLFYLESLDDVDRIRDATLEAQPILLDGRLPEQTQEDDERREYDVWTELGRLPQAIHEALQQRHGDAIPPRERNLVASGAELVVRIVQAWVQQDGVPYPPPANDIDHHPIARLAAAHYPIDYL